MKIEDIPRDGKDRCKTCFSVFRKGDSKFGHINKTIRFSQECLECHENRNCQGIEFKKVVSYHLRLKRQVV